MKRRVKNRRRKGVTTFFDHSGLSNSLFWSPFITASETNDINELIYYLVPNNHKTYAELEKFGLLFGSSRLPGYKVCVICHNQSGNKWFIKNPSEYHKRKAAKLVCEKMVSQLHVE